MPADAAVADESLEATDHDGAAPGRVRLGRLALYLALPALLLVGGATGVMLSGILDPFGLSGEHEALALEGGAGHETARDPSTLVFFDLPDLLVNLNTSGKRQSYLKMRVSLEVEDEESLPDLEKLAPRVIDNFQMYLRELRLEDLRGSAGLARLREELLRRVNASVEPMVIRDVLFREMLVQ